MELIKTKRIHLTGKKAKAFYDDIYARDGGRCVRCGRPIAYGVKYHHEPCGIYRSDEESKVVMLCEECHYIRHHVSPAKVQPDCVAYLQELYGEEGAKRE